MIGRRFAVSAIPAITAEGDNVALVQFARVVDGKIEGVPGVTEYPLEIEGEVCGESIENAVYKLLDRLNGKEDADGADGHE